MNSFVQMQNHLHLVVTLTLPNLQHCMRSFLSAAAKIINAHLGRTGKVFRERYNANEILDDDALIEKLGYVNANPCNANLVDHAVDYPGLSTARALVSGEKLVFQKVDRTALDRARRRDPKARPDDFLETHVLELTPLRVPRLAG